MNLREIITTKPKVLTEKEKDGSMKILAPFIVTGRLNKNRRLYPLSLVKREVDRLQPSIKAGALLSSADHPFTPHTSLADASHIITKLELDKDGMGWMEARVLPTTKGKNVMTIIKAGGQLGISARGVGDIRSDGTIEKNYQLLGCDIVTNPAEPKAVFDKSNVCESVEFEEENGDTQKQKDLEEAVSDLETQSYLNAIEEGFHGTQADWEKIHGGGLRKMMGIKEEDGKTSVQKLTEEQIRKRTWRYFDEARRAGFKGAYDQWKEKYPKIVEQASEGIKLSEEKVVKPKKSFVGDVRFYYNEAILGGFKGTIEQFKEQHPELVETRSYEEKMAEEAQRVFEELKEANPNSALELEHVRSMLEKEEEEKADKRLRKKAISIANRYVDSSMNIEKMVEKEFQILKAERDERKRKNWQAYKRLLEE